MGIVIMWMKRELTSVKSEKFHPVMANDGAVHLRGDGDSNLQAETGMSQATLNRIFQYFAKMRHTYQGRRMEL